ncbi:Uncharacterised protein [Mycobacteroides abscessus subsp. abscessus]|uniref:hypothetical protein n=1 Tax=Mycobacteroides abscessus TaxID=36809 RepID=UPI0009269D54|nr:hypothetical protein [Mycobacteroides abscessus]SHV92018.1 Uncharacterised protein [Mycobacteroides abscessus subsp. abscessus]SHW15027.1 Uncharacterised protein [Mycobacteroides abscessus subsp. abscessus]SHW41625.1 Uncharacterised protein [Mycobacteroides abscessus subsp. abscessus]SIA97523.1 Uncharacterised protein [Mycobacteroides abscessus subsp. abscessus]SIB35259.1 Uncharacterised protein [Mycobacteroides abscessus subsp. abscessus]
MSPDQIQAVGGVIVAILGAWQARTSRKVRDLEAQLAIVVGQRDQYRDKLRAAVRHIREWMGWARQHAPGKPTPAVPAELRDEI